MWSRVRLRLLKTWTNEYKQVERLSSKVRLSYIHNPGSEPLRYQTVGQLCLEAAEKWPDRQVIISVQDSASLDFSETEIQARRLAAGFLKLGLEPGDRLGICSPNSTHWFLTMVAAAKAGLILVAMNPAYVANEMEYCMLKVGAKGIVIEEEHYLTMMSNTGPVPTSARVTWTNLPHISLIIVNSMKSFPGTFRFCDVMDLTENFQELEKVNRKLRPEDNVNIQFTSGSTGNPKAVPQSHFNVINKSYCFGERIGMDKKHYKILAQTPFFHALGYCTTLIASLNFGSTIVLPSPSYSAQHSCEAIRTEKCTMMVGTPTMFVDLCSQVTNLPPKQQLLYQSPEVAVSGGATCSPDLLLKMKTTFSCPTVVSSYGMTETTGQCFQPTQEDSEILTTTTVGKISQHVEAKVVDSDGNTVPMGEPGELWVRSFSNMSGYWEDAHSTEAVLTRDFWIKTGDKFILTADGYGQMIGRLKDIIVRGGEKILPQEVEDLLVTHPSIIEAQVYGVRNKRLGEEVACSLRLKPGTQITQEEVKNFCKDKIVYFKIPKYIEVLHEFPKTGSGKIQKFKLQEAMEIKLQSKK